MLDTVNRPLISIVTHGEIAVLADQNNWGDEKRTTLRSVLESLVTIDLNDKAVLEAYAAVMKDSRKVRGGSRPLNANDAWIIACAKAADAVLLTTDKDFSHLKPPAWKVQYVDATPLINKGPAHGE